MNFRATKPNPLWFCHGILLHSNRHTTQAEFPSRIFLDIFCSQHLTLILFPFSCIIFADIYSSHTSLSFSPSLSEGAATPNSLTPHDTSVNENNNAANENSTNFNNNKSHHQLATNEMEISATLKTSEAHAIDGGGDDKMKMAKSAGIPSLTPSAGTIAFASTHKTSKINGKSKLVSNAGNNNGEGSYHCQFCDKSFPRLGYLKKHEQVRANCMYICVTRAQDRIMLLSTKRKA